MGQFAHRVASPSLALSFRGFSLPFQLPFPEKKNAFLSEFRVLAPLPDRLGLSSEQSSELKEKQLLPSPSHNHQTLGALLMVLWPGSSLLRARGTCATTVAMAERLSVWALQPGRGEARRRTGMSSIFSGRPLPRQQGIPVTFGKDLWEEPRTLATGIEIPRNSHKSGFGNTPSSLGHASGRGSSVSHLGGSHGDTCISTPATGLPDC